RRAARPAGSRHPGRRGGSRCRSSPAGRSKTYRGRKQKCPFYRYSGTAAERFGRAARAGPAAAGRFY
nr:hypothetical protein [Tanacetum cinerariifolium]